MKQLQDLLNTGVYEEYTPNKAILVKDLLEDLNLTNDQIFTVLVNGKKSDLDVMVGKKDKVSIIPQIAGGNKCARCGCDIGFDSEWSEEDAKEEYQKMFPNDPNMEAAMDGLCDDCYEEFKKWHSDLSPEIKEEYDKEMMETR